MTDQQLLADFYAAAYRPLRLRGRTANTDRLYQCLLRATAKVLGRPMLVADLTDLTVSAYLDLRRRGQPGVRPVSAHSVERERNQLCAMAKLARSMGLLERELTVTPEVIPRRIPEAWSEDQMQALFSACLETTGLVCASIPIQAGLWWAALVGTIYDSGERVGAVLASLRDDYHRPHLLIRAEARKGRKQDKLFQLSQSTCDLIDEIALQGEPRIFPWPRHYQDLWTRFGEIVARAGLGSGRASKFHRIRRTVASLYARAGQDATALLGHSSRRITEAHYLDPRITGGPPAPCEVLKPLVGRAAAG